MIDANQEAYYEASLLAQDLGSGISGCLRKVLGFSLRVWESEVFGLRMDTGVGFKRFRF